MKNYFSRKIRRAFLFSILALMVCSAISLITLNRASDKEKWVQHTHFVIQRLEFLLSVLKDAETGARGYIITGQNHTLQPYDHAEAADQKILDELRKLTRDNRQQQEALKLLGPNISTQFAILKGYVGKVKANQQVSPGEIERGKQVMDEARKIVGQMEDREYLLLSQRNNSWHSTWGYIPILLGLLTLLSVGSNTFFFRNLLANYFEKVKYRKKFQQQSIITRNRINIIQSVTAQVAGGNYAIRVTGQEKDVLGMLSDDINRMTEALYHSFRSVQEWMQKKDEFINITAHEFRTPLTSIKATLQIIGRVKFDSGEGRRILPFIERANNQVTKLTRILKDLLDVTKINNGSLAVKTDAFSAGKLIEDSIQEIKADNHDFTVELSGTTQIIVQADRQRISQVISNLLSNAVKYSNPGSVIRINVDESSDRVKIAVIDEGVGIPPQKLPHVFDRYFRVEETSQNYSGMGLGLYIAKGIIEQHGGEIGVESVPGKGSTFWFTLPKHQ